jgi:hypothetical protein
VAADVGGDGFEGAAELVDLHGQAGECERIPVPLAVFFDYGAQFGVPVEVGAADAGALGDGVDGDGLACGARKLCCGGDQRSCLYVGVVMRRGGLR